MTTDKTKKSLWYKHRHLILIFVFVPTGMLSCVYLLLHLTGEIDLAMGMTITGLILMFAVSGLIACRFSKKSSRNSDSHNNDHRARVSTVKTQNIRKSVKVFLFKYLLPEYWFRPYQFAYATVINKDSRVQVRGRYQRETLTVWFVVELENRQDEPETQSYSLWKQTKIGDTVLVLYRTSWIHNDVPGNRELGNSIAYSKSYQVPKGQKIALKIIRWFPIYVALFCLWSYHSLVP